jgi:hypothetical protein
MFTIHVTGAEIEIAIAFLAKIALDIFHNKKLHDKLDELQKDAPQIAEVVNDLSGVVNDLSK